MNAIHSLRPFLFVANEVLVVEQTQVILINGVYLLIQSYSSAHIIVHSVIGRLAGTILLAQDCDQDFSILSCISKGSCPSSNAPVLIVNRMLTLSRVVARNTSSRYCRQAAHPTLRPFSATPVEPKEDSKHSKLKIKSYTKDGEVVKKKELHNEALYQLEHDKAAEYASANQKKAMFVTKLGAGANLALAISKGTVGYAISSTGLIADAANSLGDLLSDAVVYYSVTEARKRATPDRPWGRGKIEPLGTNLHPKHVLHQIDCLLL